MNANDRSRLRLNIAVTRALLDEIERTPTPAPDVVAQLVEELSRVATELIVHTEPPSGVHLRKSA